MKISVGPAPSHWGKNKIQSLYAELAQSPADYVHLGETACAERSNLSTDFLGALCDELTLAGKEVFASSLILVRDEEQYSAFRSLAERINRIEINSPAFLSLAREYPAVSGAFLHIHNSVSANAMARFMVDRIVLPCELSLQAVCSIAGACTVPVEVVAHGHIPVGISTVCQTARSFGRNGDGCGCVCWRYPEGMVLRAGEKPLFRIEGPQTLSAATYCLIEYLGQLAEAGVDTVRILPQPNHTARIVGIYREVLDSTRDPNDALEELKAICPLGLCNGYFLGKAGWTYESPHMPSADVELNHRSSASNQERVDAQEQQRIADIDYVSLKNSCDGSSSDNIVSEVAQLAETMNRDPQFLKKLACFKGTRVVLSATDTGRGFMIELDKQGVTVRSYVGGSYDVKIRASERVLWDVFSGRMDADAAFFAGKANVSGSLITAFRVKNKFLSLLQEHLAHRLATGSENFVKLNE